MFIPLGRHYIILSIVTMKRTFFPCKVNVVWMWNQAAPFDEPELADRDNRSYIFENECFQQSHDTLDGSGHIVNFKMGNQIVHKWSSQILKNIFA